MGDSVSDDRAGLGISGALYEQLQDDILWLYEEFPDFSSGNEVHARVAEIAGRVKDAAELLKQRVDLRGTS